MQKKLVVIFLIVVYGCTPKSVFEIPFEKPRMVLNAILQANEYPTIYVGKTWNATSGIPSLHYIANAQVQLFENDKFIGNLIYKDNGLYQMKDFLLKPDKEYVFKVLNEEFGSVENNPTKIPNDFEIKRIAFDWKTVMPSVNYTYNNADTYKARLLSIDIKDDLAEKRYYGIGIKKTKEGFNVGGNIYSLDIGSANLNRIETDCYKQVALLDTLNVSLKILPHNPMLLFNNSCFAKKDKNIGIVIETYGTVQTTQPIYATQADKIEVSVVSVSEEYYQYAKNAKFLEGTDYAFFEPLPNYTNIKGGWGVVLGINRKNFVFKM